MLGRKWALYSTAWMFYLWVSVQHGWMSYQVALQQNMDRQLSATSKRYQCYSWRFPEDGWLLSGY